MYFNWIIFLINSYVGHIPKQHTTLLHRVICYLLLFAYIYRKAVYIRIFCRTICFKCDQYTYILQNAVGVIAELFQHTPHTRKKQTTEDYLRYSETQFQKAFQHSAL